MGPLLFLTYVNDIDICFRLSKVLCFADDMKIFKAISSSSDALSLQDDLNRLSEYCTANKLFLNPSKCSVVTYSRKINIIPTNYNLQGQQINRVFTIRDLGVIHDSKLLFQEHVDSIIAKATQILGFVMRISAK